MLARSVAPRRLLPAARALSTAAPGPNDAIVRLLSQNLEDENASPARNAYKVRSFQTAIAAVRRAPHPILTGQDAAKLKGIGPRIAQRIEFFLNGRDYVPVKHEKELREKDKTVALLQSIPGIGARTAAQLVDAGCTSVEDLHRREFYLGILSKTQRAKLDHAEHLRQEVTRAEADNVADFIRHHIASQFELHLMGDYRRDRPTAPTIDLLLLHPAHVHVPVPPAPPAVHFPKSTRGNRPQPFRPRRRPLTTSPTSTSTTAASSTSTSAAIATAAATGATAAAAAAAPGASATHAPLLAHVVRPLRDAGLLATPLHAFPARWQGIALLPALLAGAGAGATGTAGGGGESRWAEVGERLRDIRARRGSYRPIVLSLAPIKSRGAAALALTGDAEFVAALRVAATKLGLYLDEYGLWRWHANRRARTQGPRDAGDADADEGSANDEGESAGERAGERGYWELVQAESEAAIFEELGMPWVPPEKRNFAFLEEPRPSARRGRPRKTPPALL